jgi:hypothetical protein
MTAIWQNDHGGWRFLAPTGFEDEATLHRLVETAPQTLPLAGKPRLTILGREVPLGGNYADLIAVEDSGRLAIIEIKLARNAEARRAVIAQILTYVAYLRGIDIDVLERRILSRELQQRGYESIAQAAQADGADETFGAEAFAQSLSSSLTQGRFRLVLVLDDAPIELIRLVGYLEAITDGLVIDLITVSAYDIGGSRVIVPQRVEPERLKFDEPGRPVSLPASGSSGWIGAGADDFSSSISDLPDEQRILLQRLTDWAKSLDHEALINLSTWHSASGLLTLLPRLKDENVGLVTVYNDVRTPNGAYLQFNRTVIERRAPLSLDSIERLAAPARVGRGTVTRSVSDDLLSALSDAYREASNGGLILSPED